MSEGMHDKSDFSTPENKALKWAVTIVAALFLLILYRMIFGFSDQNAEESGSLSLMISEKCVEIVNSIVGKNWTESVQTDIALYLEHPIRKLAHFMEYACMGIIVYTMWRPWKRPDIKLYRLVTIWIFISAAFDEAHQYFVPGRYCSFADVLLDTAGGIFGVIICLLIRKILHHFFKWTV
jgi:VanZ family protein